MKEPIKIMLDPGHGGHDPGAVSFDGETKESKLAEEVSNKLFNLFFITPGFSVYTSRSHDKFVSLMDRARRANNKNAHLLSIHFNAGGGYGVEVFTSPGKTKSDQWAEEVLHKFKINPSIPKVRVDIGDGDLDKEARFTVLTRTRNLAILVECGFLDNAEDLARVRNPAYLEAVVQEIYRGTCRHFGIKFITIDETVAAKSSVNETPVSGMHTTNELVDFLIKKAELFESSGIKLLGANNKLSAHSEFHKAYSARLAAILLEGEFDD